MKDINNLIHFFSICLTITIKDQSQCFEEFKAKDKALIHIGMENEIEMKVYQILAAILHLGNIVFVDNSMEDVWLLIAQNFTFVMPHGFWKFVNKILK